MVEIIAALTRAGSAHKISLPAAFVQENSLVLNATFTLEIRQNCKPFRILVPSLQSKLQRFGTSFGFGVPSLFLSTGILHRQTPYKIRLIESKL